MSLFVRVLQINCSKMMFADQFLAEKITPFVTDHLGSCPATRVSVLLLNKPLKLSLSFDIADDDDCWGWAGLHGGLCLGEGNHKGPFVLVSV